MSLHAAGAVATGVVAALHVGFAALESLLFSGPVGLKVFKQTPEEAALRKPLAVNQGLYNLFLVAGLVWSFLSADPGFAYQLRLFFLGCVLVAGLVGAATASKGILFLQALPGAVALGLVLGAGAGA